MSRKINDMGIINAKPSDDYELLKKQFHALKTIIECKEAELRVYRNKVNEFDLGRVTQLEAEVASQQEMNAILTEELQQMGNGDIADVSKRLSAMREAGKEATSLIAHLKDQHGFNDEEQAAQDKIMEVFKYDGDW